MVSMVVLVLVAWLLELLPLTPSPGFSAAAALSASSGELGGIFLLGFCLCLAAELLGLRQRVLGVLLLCFKL